jgi:hypothetical protein
VGVVTDTYVLHASSAVSGTKHMKKLAKEELMQDCKDNAEGKMEALTLLLARMTQESNALWARFNYLAAVQLALMAAYGLIWRQATEVQGSVSELLLVSLIGLAISSLSLKTVARLRSWHKYWEVRSRDLDKELSENHG